MFALPLLALCAPAFGSEATDLPKELQGTVDLTYSGFAEFGALEEAGINVGQRRVLRNDLFWNVEFAPLDGVALTLGLDQTVGLRYSYPNARPMLFEPVQGGGTYLLSEDVVADETHGGGLNGVWVGAAFSPYNERYARGQKSSWRLDLGFRTGSAKKNLWVAKNGNRGSAPGGTALRVSGAASQDMGTGNPWIKFDFVKENKFTADVTDEDGTTWMQGAVIRPASELEVTGGVEIVAFDERERDNRFAVDVFGGFGYRTDEEVASGVYLPNVIDAGRGVLVSVGDQTYVLAGLHADYHINEHVRARTGPDFRFHTPFTPEHVYDVDTRGAHIGVGWMFRIEGAAQASSAQAAPELTEDAIEVLE